MKNLLKLEENFYLSLPSVSFPNWTMDGVGMPYCFPHLI